MEKIIERSVYDLTVFKVHFGKLTLKKLRTLLLFTVKRKIQAGRVHPTIHHVRQLRQASSTVQLLSQPIEAGQVRAAHKTVG